MTTVSSATSGASSSGASSSGASSSAASTSTASSASASSNSQQIAGNFQEFLTLLTTQLKNQSPLDPLDTNQFTEQLVQFAGVEQQLKTNDTLASILSSVKTSSSANAASYIGLSVTSDGSSAALSNGAASWTINPAKAASKATVTIKNAAGAIVATKTATLQAGMQTYSWNGKNTSGTAQADGQYTITVTALDASGQSVPVTTGVSGKVTAVDVSGATPILTVGSTTIPLASVKTISYQ